MDFSNYIELDRHVDRLFAEKRFNEAMQVLEWAKDAFPDFYLDVFWYQIWIRCEAEDLEGCMTTFEKEQQEKGFFFPLEWSYFDKIRSHPRYMALSETNDRLKAEAKKAAKMECTVLTPEGYSPDQRYPLFLALHGDGGGSLNLFKAYWDADAILKKGFVIVYVQSSQTISSQSFAWTTDYSIARRDLEACYNAVTEQYAIDTDKIIIGGFSGGGIASIEVSMHNTFPVRGFVALCPSLKPESFTPENVALAKLRGIKGVMLEGETESDIPAEQEMLAAFKEVGLKHQFIINPGIGHTYPVDLPQKLSEAVDYILAE